MSGLHDEEFRKLVAEHEAQLRAIARIPMGARNPKGTRHHHVYDPETAEYLGTVISYDDGRPSIVIEPGKPISNTRMWTPCSYHAPYEASASCGECRRINQEMLTKPKALPAKKPDEVAVKSPSPAEVFNLCSPDWMFKDLIVKDNNVSPSWGGRYCYVKCGCGKWKSRSYDNDTSLWRAFMLHKYGDEWNEGTRFNEVWDSCFPPPPVQQNRIKVVVKRTCKELSSRPVAAAGTLILSIYALAMIIYTILTAVL